MKNTIFMSLNSCLNRQKQTVLLFDSIVAASEIALMLNAQWDGCNGVVIDQCDEVAVNTAAKLAESTWCYQGAAKAVLARLTTDELLRRYAMGERNFINANLRCAVLTSMKLNKINLSHAHLSWAVLNQADLSHTDLTAADLSETNLSGADLRASQIVRTNLTKANLQQANLRGANLTGANLTEVNLTDADLTGANLALADLRGAKFHSCNLSGVNLAGAKFIETDLAFASQ